ncbi:ATP-binding cassette domain-containing protein [Methanomethylophilus alvi]|uniref:ATP-binding cassette domain-containing protein n=1 Tax=Methanomethylophilus alvi TaxID=1291540 RepID=UPI0037DD9BB7
MDSKNAIEIRDVVKTFRYQIEDGVKGTGILKRQIMRTKENRVIDGITLDIKKGEVVGIIGRNGSGKSTLLSMMARIMEPDSGTISVSGKVASIMELGMGFHPDMSGRENIYLKGELYGFSKKEMDERVERIIDYSGIGSYIDNPVRTYSSGMSGRLAFAIMVNVDSDIMLVDEVFSVGDQSFKFKAKEHFRKITSNGKTVVIVSHSMSTLKEYCSHVFWIESGKIKKEGKPKDVCTLYEKDINSNPETIYDLANDDIPEYQFQLAHLYQDGVHFNQDNDLYENWLSRAASQGHLQAQVEYADLLINSDNEESKSIAVEYYRSAAEHGNQTARLRLSSLSDTGGFRESLIRVYEHMISTGDCIFKYRYADLLHKIAWTEDERKKAFGLMKGAADEGYPPAEYQLGMMYCDGFGTKRDCESAAAYIESSASHGNMSAIASIADSYYNGKYTDLDLEKAFQWYLRGAKMGNGTCQYQLSTMYRDGLGIKADRYESDRWLSAFAHGKLLANINWAIDYVKMNSSLREEFKTISDSVVGNVNCLYNQFIRSIIDDNLDSKKILDYVEEQALFNNGEFIRKLINIYSQFPEYKDEKKAYEYCQKLISLGDIASIPILANLYKNGSGCEKSEEFYHNLLHRSGLLGNIHSLITFDSVYGDDVSSDMIREVAEYGNLEAIRYIMNNVNDYPVEDVIRLSKLGALQGDCKCLEFLAEIFKRGTIVEKNLEEAHKWYDMV